MQLWSLLERFCLHLYRCGVHVPAQASPVPSGHQAAGCEVSCDAWAVATFLKYIMVLYYSLYPECNTSINVVSLCLCISSRLLASPAPTSRLWGKLSRLGCISLPLITLWSGTYYQFPLLQTIWPLFTSNRTDRRAPSVIVLCPWPGYHYWKIFIKITVSYIKHQI